MVVVMQGAENNLVSRVYGNGRGWAFSRKDFKDLGEGSTIGWNLMQLEDSGTIRRVLRGVYDYPRYSELLQAQLSPDIDSVAQALARKFGWRIQPGGEMALHLIGLSTQVPAKAIYLSDGPKRSYTIGQTSLVFRHATLKEAGFKHRESGLIVQALRALGQERIDDTVKVKIRAWLPERLRAKVRKDTQRATGWVHEVIVEITNE